MIGLSENIRRHLSEHIWLYSIVVFFFVLGVCLGALTVNNINLGMKTELKSYIEGFLNITYSDGIYSADVFKQSIMLNLYTTLAVVIMGFTFLGALVIPLISGFRGFCVGFTVAFLTQSLGKGGYLLSLVSILPQNLIYIPVIIVICVCSLSLSMTALRNKYLKKHNNLSAYFLPYVTTSVILFVMLAAGSIIESYFTPFLIKLIVPYVIANTL